MNRILHWLGMLLGIFSNEPRIEGGWLFSSDGKRLGAIPAGGASGDTDTGTLADSLPSVIASARLVREQVGQNFVSSVDRKQLPMGTGRNWNEVDLAKISAQGLSEGQTLDNPQSITDNLISVEPTRVGVHIIVTVEAAQYVSQNVSSQWGALMQNAIQRKKDRDGLDLYDGATVTGGGTGTTLNSGIVAAMVAQIEGDTDESAPESDEIFFFHHSFQMHDVRTELTSGVGTYPLPAGMTADAFARGSSVVREIGGAVARKDNNVRIDGTPDAHGGVHARSGVVLVEVSGQERAFTRVLENRGGDQAMWLYDWYGYLERSAGNWLKRVLTDATAPTSG